MLRNPGLFNLGARPLPPGSHQLKPTVILYWHNKVCPNCACDPEPTRCRLATGCYFGKMLACIERGWDPPFHTTNFVPPYWTLWKHRLILRRS